MDGKTLQEQRYEIEMISQVADFEYGQALIRVLQAEIDQLREELELNPIFDAKDIRRDVRYKLGYIAALRKTIRRPQEAHELLAKLQRRA